MLKYTTEYEKKNLSMEKQKFPHRKDRCGREIHKKKTVGDNFPQRFSTFHITFIVIASFV